MSTNPLFAAKWQRNGVFIVLNQNLARAFREKIAGDKIELSDIIAKSKISRSTLYNILNNDNYSPSFDHVERLAILLNVSIDKYLTNDG